MLQGEHPALLSTFIKLLYVIKIFVLSIFEWPVNTGFTVHAGIFFAILGRGPRAFQIGKISAVNHYFGKFSKQTRTAFLVSLKTKLAITHTIAIKLRKIRCNSSRLSSCSL